MNKFMLCKLLKKYLFIKRVAQVDMNVIQTQLYSTQICEKHVEFK